MTLKLRGLTILIILLMAGNDDLIRTFLTAYGYSPSDFDPHFAKRLTTLFHDLSFEAFRITFPSLA